MSAALTLYHLEENLVALFDTADMVDDPAQQEAIIAEIVTAHLAAVEKRDRVGQFLAHCEHQQTGIDAEIRRLQALRKAYATTQDKVEHYIVHTIRNLGKDDTGRFRRLEGKTCVFSIRACPASVEVQDEAAIPPEYKTLTITIPAAAWQEFVDCADIDERTKFLSAVKKAEVSIDKKSVKAAIESAPAGEYAAPPVPGASLSGDKYTLVRR